MIPKFREQLAHVGTIVLRRAPLFPIASGLLGGIVTDEHVDVSWLVYAVALVAASALAVNAHARRSAGIVLLVAASFAAGGLLHRGSVRTSSRSLDRYANDAGQLVYVNGIVVSEPMQLGNENEYFAPWSFRRDRTILVLDCISIDGAQGPIPVSGRLRVTIQEPILDIRLGEPVRVFGWLRSLRPPANPSAFDWARFQRRQGILATLSCHHREAVARLDPGITPRRPNLIERFRSHVRALLIDDLGPDSDDEASLLQAMVLGHRSTLDRRLDEIFIASGCMHFLAASGTNVAMLGSFVWGLARLIRIRKRTCVWIVMAAIVAYALVADPRPPILRATVVSLLFCGSVLLGRNVAGLNWISAAVILLVLIDPNQVFDVGFQLSFAAVLGISYLTGPLMMLASTLIGRLRFLQTPGLVPDRSIPSPGTIPSAIESGQPLLPISPAARAVQWLIQSFLAASLAAWLVGIPTIATVFNRVQPFGAIGSFLAFPLVYLAMMIGFAKVLLASVLPSAAAWLTPAITQVDAALLWLVNLLAGLPGASVNVRAPPLWWTLIYYGGLLGLIVWYRQRCAILLAYQRPNSMAESRGTQPIDVPHGEATSARQRPRLLWPIAASVWLAITLLGPSLAALADCAHGRLQVTVLAVGAGSATVIELPAGQTILYDAGSMSTDDAGRRTILPYLRSRGINHVDRVYVSHPNLDHFNGLPTVMDHVSTGPVFLNSFFERLSPSGSASRHLLDVLQERQAGVTLLPLEPAQWTLGGATFELLWPVGELDPATQANDTSTVLRMTWAGHSILFTGDIEDRAQAALLGLGNLGADLLILPHHGSAVPTTQGFIRAVNATTLIQSSHESASEHGGGVTNLVESASLYNTADRGAIQIIVDDKGFRIVAMR